MEKADSDNVHANPMAIEEDGERLNVQDAMVVDPLIERRLKRKTDLIIIPVLAVTYLFKYDLIPSSKTKQPDTDIQFA